MGRRKQAARVLGPYREERRGETRLRVVVVDHDGGKTSFVKQMKKEARQIVKAAWITLGVPEGDVTTVIDAVALFTDEKVDKGFWGDRTVDRSGADLRFFAAAAPSAPIEVVNVQWIRSYLERLQVHEYALASQKTRYHTIVEFLGWCVRKRFLRANPCDLIDRSEKPWVGRRAQKKLGRGKPQLANLGEAGSYLGETRKLPTPARRVAAALPLLCGSRPGEVLHLLVRDVDFEAGKIWHRDIDEADNEVGIAWNVKTMAGTRTTDIPDVLQEDLKELCRDRKPTEFLLASKRTGGKPYEYKWLNRMVQRVCKAAGVTIVCTQGLRDTYSSIEAEHGRKNAADVGKLLGHADGGQTAKRHYIGAPEHRAALKVVEGGRS